MAGHFFLFLFHFLFSFYFPDREREERTSSRQELEGATCSGQHALSYFKNTLTLSFSEKLLFLPFFHFPMYFIFSTLFNHFSLPLDRLSLPLFYSPSIKLIFIFSFSTFSYSLLRRFCDGLDFQSRDFIRVPRI